MTLKELLYQLGENGFRDYLLIHLYMKYLQDIVDSAMQSVYPWLENLGLTLTIPPENQEWDYSINVAKLAKPLKRSPNEIAKEITDCLSKRNDVFRLVQVVWAYINLCLTDEEYFQMMDRSAVKTNNNLLEWTIVVDYIWVNIWKPLHIWHICTPSIWQVFCNIYRYRSMNVIGDVHTGDWWGIFWRLISGWKKWGDEAKFLENPVEHLLELYQKISWLIEPDSGEKDLIIEEECRNEFKKLSSGDSENMTLWAKFTKESLWDMQKTINLLHVHPDVSIGESFYEWLPLPKIGNYPNLEFTMAQVVDELITKWIAKRWEDWSVGIEFEKDTNLPSNMLQKRDGTHGYFASDLACIKYRTTNGWDPKKIIYCTDVRQETHFKQVFFIARKAGWIKDGVELVHAPNGFISLPEWAMSSRKWNIIRLQDLIDEAFIRIKNILVEKWRILSDENLREIAVWAMKYSYLMQDREKNSIFSWDKALNLEWNSWPYIQYAYVRSMKLIRDSKVQIEGKKISDYSWLPLSKYEKKLMRLLLQMEEKVEGVILTHKPHVLAWFCYDLAVSLNSFYVHTYWILTESDQNLKEFRILLAQKVADTLKLTFELLGIKMPTEM